MLQVHDRISTRSRWRRNAAATLAVILCAALAACSNSTNDADTGGDDSGKGGTFTFGIIGAPPTLNPALGDPAYNPLYQWAYEPLVVLEPDGTYSSGLADKFGYTDDENKVYEVTLREDLQFSDGETLDAEALKTFFTYEKKQSSSAGLLLGSVESMEVTDPLTVRLTLGRSDPGFSFYFAQAFGAGNVISPKAIKDPDTLNTGTAGAGQYTAVPGETVTGDHYTFEKNPNYYDQDAIQFDKVVVKIIANASSMLQALKSGQIQAASADITTLQTAKSDGINVVSAPQTLVGLNFTDRTGELSEPMGDVRVRQALQMAVDRKAIAQGLLGDESLALSQFALPDTPGFLPELEEEMAYDPDKARQLLAEAGYPDGFTLKTLTTPFSGLDKITEAIAGELAKVGVTLEITSKPTPNDYLQAMLSNEYPAIALGYGLNDANSLYAGFINPQGPFNPAHYSDSELDKLYATYFATPSEEAGELEQAINQRLVDQGWALPVLGTPLGYYVADGFKGLEATALNSAVPHFTELRRG
ncbi:peptide/nickel transport system substrate-binding protein [Nocardioides alpinus]|nr:peptide/nickel transport system substrate-binding protein [Nocardioides alpinus]